MKKLLLLAIITLISACSLVPETNSRDQRLKDLAEATNQVNTPTIEGSTLESAIAAEKAGNILKAEYYYGQLLKSKPGNPDYQFKYAEILRKMGKCEDALVGYNKVLAEKKDNIDAQEGKGLCLLNMGKNTEASPIFKSIIANDKTRWKSLNAAGLIFASDKKYTEAGQYFTAAASASSNHPVVLNNQGLVKALIGNFKDGIKLLQEAAQKADKGSVQRRSIELNLALVYGISGDLDMAEKTARENLTQAQLYNNMGVYAELSKDKELAKTYLNKALQETKIYYERAWENLERVKSEK